MIGPAMGTPVGQGRTGKTWGKEAPSTPLRAAWAVGDVGRAITGAGCADPVPAGVPAREELAVAKEVAGRAECRCCPSRHVTSGAWDGRDRPAWTAG